MMAGGGRERSTTAASSSSDESMGGHARLSGALLFCFFCFELILNFAHFFVLFVFRS